MVIEKWYKIANGWVGGWFANYKDSGERTFAEPQDSTILITQQASPHLNVRVNHSLAANKTGEVISPGVKRTYSEIWTKEKNDVVTEPTWKKVLPKILIGFGALALAWSFLGKKKKNGVAVSMNPAGVPMSPRGRAYKKLVSQYGVIEGAKRWRAIRKPEPFTKQIYVSGSPNGDYKIYHSYSLPYFTNGYVSFFDSKSNKIMVRREDFKDITTEGGRFRQFYTYKVRKRALNSNTCGRGRYRRTL